MGDSVDVVGGVVAPNRRFERFIRVGRRVVEDGSDRVRDWGASVVWDCEGFNKVRRENGHEVSHSG